MPDNNLLLILSLITFWSTCDEDRGEQEEEGGAGEGLQQEVLSHGAHRGELLQVAQQPQDHDYSCKHKHRLLEKVTTRRILSEVKCVVVWMMMSSY